MSRRSRSILLLPLTLAVSAVAVSSSCTSGVRTIGHSEAGPTGTTGAPEQVLLGRAAAEAAGSGCGPIDIPSPFQPEALDRAHIGGSGFPDTPPPLDTYSTQPPASGPHDAVPLPSGVYEEPVPWSRTIHSMEHGAVIVWLSPQADASKVAEVQAFFERPEPGHKVIVSPYDFDGPGGQLVEGTQMVTVAWHRIQRCDLVSLPVAFAFVARFRSEPRVDGVPYEGEAPEPEVPIDPS